MDLCERIALDWENPVGQYLIECMYFEEEGVPEDKTSEVRWISLAAKSGWPYAIARMGEIYSFDAPVKKDYEKAIIWFDKVAKNDDNETDFILGKNGWENEHTSSCATAGSIYLAGIDVKQDYTKAMKWFKKNSTHGSTIGLLYIGLMYYKGLGVERNHMLDLVCFQQRIAEEENDVNAFYFISEVHQEGGDDVPQNSQVSSAFYEQAFKPGNPMAAARIVAIHSKLKVVEPSISLVFNINP
ncbi:hypothetical protein BD770DRAFT_447265 [Pilaira anomala]|nr:hypothetical protein BD770DRAFT_447265 [Pilaira anomala]